MGNLMMSFRGICMHLNRHLLAMLVGHPVHRVIAVRADEGAVTKDWGTLPPHVCYLETTDEVREKLLEAGLPVDSDGRFRLEGASLRLANPAHPHLPVTTSLENVPRLTGFSPGMILRPNLHLVHVPANADAYVEITHGFIQERTYEHGGGMYSTWTVETDGDPILLLDVGGRRIEVTIPSSCNDDFTDCNTFADGVPGSIVLHNDTTNGEDKQFDFLLHYLAAVGGIDAQTFPNGFPVAPMDLLPPDGIRPNVGTTTSCSNSQYP